MSGGRHGWGEGAARWRALAAILSLYGLVLHAFLTGLSPVPAAGAPGILCAAHAPGDEAPGPAHEAHPCCTVTCLGLLAPPVPAAVSVAWPRRVATDLAWRAEAPPPARGPPVPSAFARGPPTA
ncbi:hypothetical protein OPKNFCMD_0099 [Methylobacterium crusticola]|uniref:DUF2946 domain-containing protein n=1 Tax=Methylobacterium crusticola TaxID=1697972 RepID=A0ABQ4QQ25_9HYPH|nr:hypothetical protein [Methylobacterium crusticola]GJD47393.1 hypothetical protein OPKNFCMD_0099 [Methylobacterium crusticola]